MQINLLKKLPKILLRRGRNFFACALLTLCKAPRTTGKSPRPALYAAQPLKKLPRLKSYYAAVGIFACLLFTLCKAPRSTGKKPGPAFCAASPPETAARPKILRRCGRNFPLLPLSATFLPGFAKPPCYKLRTYHLLDEALGLDFSP